MHTIFMPLLLLMLGCGTDNSPDTIPPDPLPTFEIEVVPTNLLFSAAGDTKNIVVKANAKWTVSSDQSWCSLSPVTGYVGETSLKVTTLLNQSGAERTAVLTFVSGTSMQKYTVKQELGMEESHVPAGYTLVWQDEFNDSRLSGGKPALPNTSDWWYETGNGGWGNNEIENYVAGVQGTDTCAIVTDGTLKIIAKKIGGEVLSIRMNTSKSWTYGYFEARLKLPQGKGTWPAFWMMPKNFVSWPDDGEIDIMEEVGYRPNYVSSSIHCKSYYHGIGTQKTAEKYVATAESDFHVYAVEWTEDYIWGFIDGESYFKFPNDKAGNKDTWPFNTPFYLKLNLAWGGNWGGAQGVDESKLPATYEIDYVRVFQKQ